MDRKQRNKLIADTIVSYRQQYQSLLQIAPKQLAITLIQSKIYGFVDCLCQLRLIEVWTIAHLCDELIGEITV